MSGTLSPADPTLSTTFGTTARDRRRHARRPWTAPATGDQRLIISGAFRDELLNETLFPSLTNASRQVLAWQHDYYHHRPPSCLGNIPPVEFVAKKGPAMRAAWTQELTCGLSANSEESWVTGHIRPYR
ncbi:integrase core domain-containing protein [Oceanicola sp. 22II-s10i]|uniref:integrase core domain-containing protein n=1 Tax=Oceanicola sp. 22II-s10i TaxID=1317116 RepID=UPI000B521DFF